MKTHPDEGWNSPYCTKGRCRRILDPGAGVQFLDEEGRQQRYCGEHWKEYAADPEPPEVKEEQAS